METRISNMYKYFYRVLFFLFFLLLGTVGLIIYINNNILDFFQIFNNGDVIINYILDTIKNNIINNYYTLGIIFLSYSILLGYMKSKSLYVYNKNNVSLHFNIFSQIYKMFNFIIVPILFVYLIIKLQYLDLIIISLAFIITKKLFLPLMNSYLLLLISYKELEFLNNKNVQKNFELLKKSLKTLSFKVKKKTKEEKTKDDPIKGILIRFLLLNIHYYEKVLITLTIFLPILFSYLNLNLITITYILLTLIFWTHIIFVVEHGYPNKTNIKLNNGKIIEEIYIVENIPDSINILNKKEQIKKIYKNNILEIDMRI